MGEYKYYSFNDKGEEVGRVDYNDVPLSSVILLDRMKELSYISRSGLEIKLIVRHGDSYSCNSCFLNYNSKYGLECFDSNAIVCGNSIVELLPYDKDTIPLDKIKSVFCNDDMCPYHSDSCNNNVVIDNPLCLIKLLSK